MQKPKQKKLQKKNKIFFCNFKMWPSKKSTIKDWYTEVKKNINPKLSFVPLLPAIFLDNFQTLSKGKMLFGAQNMCETSEEPNTGEVSAQMLVDMGVKYVLIGHSERKKRGELDVDVAKKVKIAIDSKLTPVICIGEDKREKESTAHLKIIRDKIVKSLGLIDKEDLKKIVIAYEPVFAIGKTFALDSYEIEMMIGFIYKNLSIIYGKELAEKVKVLYGGSVNEENVLDILAIPNLDGVLVGRLSTDPKALIAVSKKHQKA